MIIGTGTLANVGDATPAYQINGRVDIWRGAGSGTLVLERRSVATSTWRWTGDTLTVEGSAAVNVGTTGGMEYRLRCTAGGSIEWEIAA